MLLAPRPVPFGGGQTATRILSQAVAYWDVRMYSGSGNLIDLSGHGHHAQFGSTSGADSNDPLHLLPEGNKPYLYLPGSASNNASIPDAAPLKITSGVLRVEVDARPASVTTNSYLASKWLATGNQRSWLFNLSNTGGMTVQLTPDGATSEGVASSTGHGVSADARKWFAFDWDIAAKTMDFEVSDNGTAWSAVGTQRPVTTAALFDSTATVLIGAINAGAGGNDFGGKIYRLRIYHNGNLVLDVDPTNPSAYNATRTSLTAVTGQTVTINRSTSGRKASVVDRPLLLFGTDDYLEVADHPDLDIDIGTGFTAVIALRQYATPTNFGRYFTKKEGTAGATLGWTVASSGTNIATRADIGDGTDNEARSGTVQASGSLLLFGARYRPGWWAAIGPATSLFEDVNDAPVSPIANSQVLRIGARSDSAASFQDFEMFAAAIFQRALSEREIRQLNRELLGVPV